MREPGASEVLTCGLTFSPARAAFFASRPAASAPPRLNLELARPRGGELSRYDTRGALPVLPRPPEVATATMWLGPQVKPGVNPVSKTEMYLFVTEPRPDNDFVDPATFADRLRALLADPSAFEIVTFDDASRAPAGLAALAPAW